MWKQHRENKIWPNDHDLIFIIKKNQMLAFICFEQEVKGKQLRPRQILSCFCFVCVLIFWKLNYGIQNSLWVCATFSKLTIREMICWVSNIHHSLPSDKSTNRKYHTINRFIFFCSYLCACVSVCFCDPIWGKKTISGTSWNLHARNDFFYTDIKYCMILYNLFEEEKKILKKNE